MTNINRKDIADNTAFQAFLGRITLFGYVEVTNIGEIELYRDLSDKGTFNGFRVRSGGAVLASGQLTLTLSTFDSLIGGYSGEPLSLQAQIDALSARVQALEDA
jgi:hypothetical protein